MESGDYDPPLAPGLLAAQSWQATVILGAVTLILGLIVSFTRVDRLTSSPSCSASS